MSIDAGRLARERARIEGEPLPASIDALVVDAVARHAHADCLVEVETRRTLTYAETGAAVARMAGALAEAGVGWGTRVAVLLPNRLEFPVTWLALARLGAVMVSVNARSTATELAFIVTDSAATHLVTDDHGRAVAAAMPAEAVAGLLGRVLGVDELVARGSSATPITVAPRPPDGDTVVGLQYTSGTTGMPKACVLTHRYWLITAAQVTRTWPERPRRILADAPFFYMDPQFLLLMAFLTGAATVMAPHPSLTRFLGWLRDFDIDCAEFTDGIAAAPPAPSDRDHPLRHAWTYALPGPLQAPLQERYNVTLREFYGMTEIGLGLYTPFWETGMVGSGSCGVATPWIETRVVDPASLAPVAPGVQGELQVRGPGLFSGYHDRPEANAAAFLPGGWFRTGDLFTVDAQGRHWIVGRLKDMIRRAGENIAAAEVEGVLLAAPGVAEAAVIAVPDPVREEEVLAFIVPAPATPAPAAPASAAAPAAAAADRDGFVAGVLAHAARHLAPFKVPRYVVLRGALPRTPSDRVAKSVLRDEHAPDPTSGAFDRVTGSWRP